MTILPSWPALSTMLMIASIDFGASFIYDLPQSLSIAFDEKLGLDDGKCLYFYSAYAFPNLGVGLIGAWLINKFGFRKCIVAYSSLICLGHATFLFGALVEAYPLMILGRSLQGAGAENLMITQYFTSHKFFEVNYLSLAMGLDMSLSFLASVIAFYGMPWIYLRFENLNLALLLAAVFPAGSLVAAIFFVRRFSTDDKVDRMIKAINQSADDPRGNSLLDDSGFDGNQLSREEGLEELKKIQNTENEKTHESKKFKFRDLKKFPVVFWLVAGIALMDSTAYYAFIGVSTKMISVKYSLKYDDAKDYPLIVPFVQMILIPFMTKFTYHYGGKPIFLALSSIIGLFAIYIISLGSNISPYFGVVLFGLFFTLHLSSFWPCAAISSEAAHVDIGLGIVNTMQNLSSFLMPIILGSRFSEINKDNADDYLKILAGMLGIGFILSTSLTVIDLKTGKRLLSSEHSRKVQNPEEDPIAQPE